MAQGIINDTTLTAIGDAIREKTGETGKILPKDMPTAIANIKGGGGDPLNVTTLCGDDYDTKYGAFAMFNPNDAFYKALCEAISFTGSSVHYLYPPASVVNANKDIVYHFYDNNTSTYTHTISIYATEGTNIPAASKIEYLPKVIIHNKKSNIDRIDCTCSQFLANSRFNKIKEFDYHDFVECPELPNVQITWTQGYACFSQTTVKKVVLPPSGGNDWNNTFARCYSLEEIYMGVGNVPGYATPEYCEFSGTFNNLPSCHTIEITGDGDFYNNNPNCIIDFTTVGFGFNSHNNSNTEKADSKYSRTQFMNTVNKLFPSQSTGVLKVAAGAGANNADGGMDALTDAEIAVATSKGWTVSIS